MTEIQGTGQGREMLPKIEADIRELERSHRTASLRLERSDCWDQFLFSKTLRRDPRCVQLNDEVESARQRLADLDRQRKQIMGTGDRSLQDEIIRELARNGCGQQYEQEARKRDQRKQSLRPAVRRRGGDRRAARAGEPVRQPALCHLPDGVRAPVRRLLLPGQLLDAAQPLPARCRGVPVAMCGASRALLPSKSRRCDGADGIHSTQQPYTGLRTAFRYRKEFVHGCSCKQAEYNPGLEKKAEACRPPPPAAGVRIGAKK